MSSRPRPHPWFAAACSVAILCVARTSSAAPPSTGDTAERKLEEEDDQDPAKAARLHMWADTVIGLGRAHVIEADSLRIGNAPVVHHLDSVPFSSQNLDVGLSYEFLNDLAIGVEFPITHAAFNSPLGTRATTAVGNLELNAEYDLPLSKHFALVPSFELALPTAVGTEMPTAEEVLAEPGKERALGPLDQFAAQRAAAAARGWEENHLFAPARLGFVPRIGVLYENGRLELEPYAKVGALVSTNGAPFEGDVILAARASYRVQQLVDVGLRVWTNIPIGGKLPEDVAPVGVCEPQVRGHFGSINPVLGVVLPFVGPLSHPENVGIRLALAGHI